MADLLALSRAAIDEGKGIKELGPMNRINHQLSELDDDLAIVEAFSHAIVIKTDEGLVSFDTSNEHGGQKCVDAIRGWSKAPFNTVIYTHGHIDHVGGCGAFVADSCNCGQKPRIVGHANVAHRFDRYNLTNGYNTIINERQFGQFKRRGYDLAGERQFLPATSPAPDTTYTDTLTLNIGGVDIELNHAKGETDDHTWGWIPSKKTICAGDFFIWAFPNAGNPQKAQRYPREWAVALRDMAGKGAELFLPAHGLPIDGRERIANVLTEVADALDYLVNETLQMMNQGARLNDILHSVHLDKNLLAKAYLAPVYDEPEFVIQNIWRLYGGWYDGNPANLKPAKESKLANEMALLAGGAMQLARRAEQLLHEDIRIACHLVEMAALAAPLDGDIQAMRAQIFQERRNQETSLMAKGIFGHAANSAKKQS